MVPDNRKYSRAHVWCKIDDNICTLGLTERGLREMGEVEFLELPDPEDDVLGEIAIIEIETEKGVFDIFSPVDGVVVESHYPLEENPEKIEADPYGNGWLIKIRIEDPSQAESLMTAQEYEETVEGNG
jgi:glycine cleavage system H protein